MTILRRIAAACLAALPWSAERQADAAEPPLVIAKSGYVFAGGLMLLAALTAFWLGVDAERKPLEDVAAPLAAVE